jgi:hypothetical protein
MSLQCPVFIGLEETRVFSPIPVVSFTQDLPPGTDADCLLFNCRDLRNILFTIFGEKGARKNCGIFFFLMNT